MGVPMKPDVEPRLCWDNTPKSEELVVQYLKSPKYLKTKPKWLDNIKHWNLKSGTKILVRSFNTSEMRPPLSEFPVVITTENLKKNYMDMLKELQKMYTAVLKGCVLSQVEFSVGQYAVAWIPERERFYRVRIRDVYIPGVFLVQTLDSCQKLVVPYNQLFPICEQFLSLRPMVIMLRLDELERFDYCRSLEELINAIVNWKRGLLEFEVTRVVKWRIYGLVRYPGTTEILNHTLLNQLWRNLARPRLPSVGESYLKAHIVHAEENASVSIQLVCPTTLALRNYFEQSKPLCDSLVQNPDEFQKRKACLPLDPKMIYMILDGKSKRFIRVRLSSKSADQSSKRGEDDEITLRAIDIGNTVTATSDSLLVASSIHPYLGLVPPQCILVHLANVATLNVGRFLKEYGDKSVTFRVIRAANSKCPAEVNMYHVKNFSEKGTCGYVSINRELISLNIGRPTTGITELEEAKRPLAQLEYIEMKGTTYWKNFITKGISPGDRIVCSISKVFSPVDFVLQPAKAREVIGLISKEISDYVEIGWMQTTIERIKTKPRNAGWFYAYKCPVKNLYLRVRMSKLLRDKMAKVLLIDFGEYVEVSSEELLPALPLGICTIGPQSARVQNFDLRDVDGISTLSDLQVLECEVCRAAVESVEFDNCGMTVLELNSLDMNLRQASLPADHSQESKEEDKS